MKNPLRILMFALGTSLAGCSSLIEHMYSVERHDGANGTLSTDATRRIISDRPRAVPNGSDAAANRIVCAEPSPDVAAAIASSVRLAIELGGQRKSPDGSTADYKAGTEYSRAVATSITQLGERLATIQLLRDKMYRACEAYANGAIGGASYTLMLARLDKTMTTLLSTQMAAGAFGAAAATAGATASLGASPSAGKGLLEKQDAFKAAVDSLNKLLRDKESDASKLDAARRDVTDKLAELTLAEQASMPQSFALAGAQSGSRDGLPDRMEHDALNVRLIHRNFLDDDGVEPLVDACLMAMDAPFDKQVFRSTLDRMKSSEASGDRAARVSSLENEYKRQSGNHDAESARARALSQVARDDIVAAFATTGNPFQSFCLGSVLSGKSEFLEDRIRSKLRLRKLDAYATTSNPKLSLCTDVLMSNFKDDKKKEILGQLKCENVSNAQPASSGSRTDTAPTGSGSKAPVPTKKNDATKGGTAASARATAPAPVAAASPAPPVREPEQGRK